MQTPINCSIRLSGQKYSFFLIICEIWIKIFTNLFFVCYFLHHMKANRMLCSIVCLFEDDIFQLLITLKIEKDKCQFNLALSGHLNTI